MTTDAMAATRKRILPGAVYGAATVFPTSRFTTEELLAHLGERGTEPMCASLRATGVQARHSVVANLDAVVGGRDEPARPTTTTTALAEQALRGACRDGDIDPQDIGLLIAVTNTQAAILPGLAQDLLAQDERFLQRDVATVNMQGQGCSALLKALEVASWYLRANPGRLAAVVASEAQTALARVDPGRRPFLALGDAAAHGPDEVQRSLMLIQTFLFGDGAAAFVLGGPGDTIGDFTHLSNVRPEDARLAAMYEGGSAHPEVNGVPHYVMRPELPARGAAYGIQSVANLRTLTGRRFRHDRALIHTGSRKILDHVVAALEISPSDPGVELSYQVLREHGNLSSVATGFMLEQSLRAGGRALVVAFGVGFTATAALIPLRRANGIHPTPVAPDHAAAGGTVE